MNPLQPGRKFYLVVAVLLIATGLLLAKILTGPEWIEFTRFLVTAYLLGNVGAAAVAKVAPALTLGVKPP